MTKARALTEERWLTSDEPYELLRHLEQHCRLSRLPGSRRLRRLYACGCCRRAWHLMTDERERRVVETAERAADGRASRRELAEAEALAEDLRREREAHFRDTQPRHGSPEMWEAAARVNLAHAVAAVTSGWLSYTAGGPAMSVAAALSNWEARHGQEAAGEVMHAAMRRHAELLRDLFGNPFRPPPAAEPGWAMANQAVVARMAQAIYDDHRFGELPALADALEEAGCADAAILAHCRGGGEHARGCWVVDLLLGKR
jgi:hypothetical protein